MNIKLGKSKVNITLKLPGCIVCIFMFVCMLTHMYTYIYVHMGMYICLYFSKQTWDLTKKVRWGLYYRATVAKRWPTFAVIKN